MRYSFLSHEYAESIPVFGEVKQLAVRQIRSTDAGNTTNEFSIEIQSHWGTHVDAPRHFFSSGRNITSYAADYFVFSAPQVIAVTLEPSEILEAATLMETVREDCDLLLVKSGWTEFRSQPLYYQDNPGLSLELAQMLRSQRPLLRAVGIDWISISAFRHRELGREVHRVLLDPAGDHTPKFIIEDMNLSAELCGLQRVIVAPLRVAAFDSAPCTVLGEWDD